MCALATGREFSPLPGLLRQNRAQQDLGARGLGLVALLRARESGLRLVCRRCALPCRPARPARWIPPDSPVCSSAMSADQTLYNYSHEQLEKLYSGLSELVYCEHDLGGSLEPWISWQSKHWTVGQKTVAVVACVVPHS